ncbi:NAD(P)-binding protein [Venustampulla echinocandica]|uniref:NAD(P)-binding protein n=1 Tax=Venustampulla echinocandica TaxID=2656787 RepID=A0A370TP47_9HELO|nr:NAD(P)-binding protein [Venustampulla echinocandica]RDL37303.1 NAD(P)-binding protein [Venustampulla echinocandica]
MSPSFEFDISPEKEASIRQYLYRQLFVTPQVVSRSDVDLSGKTAIVTGSNVGLGLECARQLLDLGLSKLILAVRDESKGETARTLLLKGRSLDASAIEVWKLDLSSYDSVAKFAERASTLEHLDIAMLNAGVYKLELTINPKTGFEEVVQVNYLSTALLTLLLLPIMNTKKSGTAPGRITIVSSDTAAWAKFLEKKSDPLLKAFKTNELKWNFQERYSTSKLLGQLFLFQLAKHVAPSAVTVDAVNPGFCYGSGLQRDGNGTALGFIVRVFTRILGRPITIGARPLTAAAVKFGHEVHGQYVEDCRIRPMAPMIYTPEGERIAKKLWDELMDELSFAGVRDIVSALEKQA